MQLRSLSPALLVLLATAACQSAPAGGQPELAPSNVEQLVRQYAAATGTNVTYDEGTGALLASLAITPVGPAELNVLRVGGPRGPASARAEPPELELIPLRYAAAPELADALSDLVSAGAQGARDPAVKVLSDERTNSLLVMAPPDHMPRLRALIALLDREVTAGGSAAE